jgi:DNA-binding protein Alba
MTEEQGTRQPVKKAGKKDNLIFVGKKPTMSYVLAVITQFSDGMKEVHVKARGKSINRAVDVAEVVKNRFMQELTKEVVIGTDEIMDDNNNKLNISTIDILLKK